MTNVFKRGQELGRSNGLSVFLKNKDQSPRNAAEIFYNIYYVTEDKVEILMPPANRVPVNPSMGEYFADFQIPIDANIGDYRIRWFFRQYTNTRQIEIMNPFSVISDGTQIVNLPGSSAIEVDLVRSLRIMLRDNNPSRNYHFMPPSGEESVNSFTRVFGYVWEDQELLEYLRIANDSVNLYPPRTFYSNLDQLIKQMPNWRALVINGAMIYATQALTLNWIVDEFSYSIGGVSLDIEKSSKYQGMMNDLQSRFNEMITNAKDTVKIIIGLQQARYGVGIRSTFGPNVGRGSLVPRRFSGL